MLQHSTGFDCAGSRYRILYATAALAADADTMQQLCTQAARNLESYFAPEDPRDLMSRVTGRLELLDAPTAQATATDSVGHTKGSGPNLDVCIEHLAPSCNGVHGPSDRDYHLRTMVHELSQGFLDRITRRRQGWLFFNKSAPPWFVDGYEDYLAIAMGPVAKRASARKQVDSKSKADGSRLNDHNDLDLNRYVYGASVVGYLHDLTDNAKVQSILSVSKRTFDESLMTQTGHTRQSLFLKWKGWLATI